MNWDIFVDQSYIRAATMATTATENIETVTELAAFFHLVFSVAYVAQSGCMSNSTVAKSSANNLHCSNCINYNNDHSNEKQKKRGNIQGS